MRGLVVVIGFVLCAVGAGCGGRLFGGDDDVNEPSDAGIRSDAGDKKPVDSGVSLGKCPDSLPGPKMAPMTTPEGGAYCIDSTEISNADYTAFLASQPDPITQALACSKNVSFTPPFNWPTTDEDKDRPVVNVDWCDAKAYCEWAGKELCGAPRGQAAPPHDYQNASTSLWFAACSDDGTSTFLYGDNYDPKICNGADYDTAYTLNVDEPASCAVVRDTDGTQLFDMSGNVWEWENACEGDTPGDRCRVRGGSFRSSLDSLTCAASTLADRDSLFDDFGFRCCAE